MKAGTGRTGRARWQRLVVVVLGLVLLGSLAGTGSAGAAEYAPPVSAPSSSAPNTADLAAWDARTGQRLAAWACDAGDVCFWTGFNGTGSRCNWGRADADWTSGAIVCSWATTSVVKSVWNRGVSDQLTGVAYYVRKNYVSRIGCTRQGARGNLAGTYTVLSHIWINTSCG